MIRRFLAREMEFLLAECGAPDLRTLWRRIAFYTWVWTISATVLLGLVVIGETYGLEWMYAAVFIIILLPLRSGRSALLYRQRPVPARRR